MPYSIELAMAAVTMAKKSSIVSQEKRAKSSIYRDNQCLATGSHSLGIHVTFLLLRGGSP